MVITIVSTTVLKYIHNTKEYTIVMTVASTLVHDEEEIAMESVVNLS